MITQSVSPTELLAAQQVVGVCTEYFKKIKKSEWLNPWAAEALLDEAHELLKSNGINDNYVVSVMKKAEAVVAAAQHAQIELTDQSKSILANLGTDWVVNYCTDRADSWFTNTAPTTAKTYTLSDDMEQYIRTVMYDIICSDVSDYSCYYLNEDGTEMSYDDLCAAEESDDCIEPDGTMYVVNGVTYYVHNDFDNPYYHLVSHFTAAVESTIV
jgi:hypothetical protein